MYYDQVAKKGSAEFSWAQQFDFKDDRLLKWSGQQTENLYMRSLLMMIMSNLVAVSEMVNVYCVVKRFADFVFVFVL